MVFYCWILAGKKVNSKYLSWFIKGLIASTHSQRIVEEELKSVQRYATAKAVRKKLIRAVAKKSGIITLEDIRAFFSTKEKSELQKTKPTAQKTINALQKQKDPEHKKKLERLKKF